MALGDWAIAHLLVKEMSCGMLLRGLEMSQW